MQVLETILFFMVLAVVGAVMLALLAVVACMVVFVLSILGAVLVGTTTAMF